MPCMPGMPSASGCESGNAPRAISVVVTGAWTSLGQLAQGLVRVRLDHAAADVEHRPPGLRAAGRPPPRSARRRAARASGSRAGPCTGGQDQVDRGLQDVLGQVDQDRARPAGARRCGRPRRSPPECAPTSVTSSLCLVIGAVMPVMSDSWKASVPIMRGRHLAGDRHHRNRVHVGVGQRGDQVGRARAAGGHADADPAGGPGVALGGVPGALLVPDQHVPQRGRPQRVVGRQDRAARQAEDDIDALATPGCGRAPGLRSLPRVAPSFRSFEVARETKNLLADPAEEE